MSKPLSKHEMLVFRAREAISAVLRDTTVSTVQTRRSLVQLKKVVDECLAAPLPDVVVRAAGERPVRRT